MSFFCLCGTGCALRWVRAGAVSAADRGTPPQATPSTAGAAQTAETPKVEAFAAPADRPSQFDLTVFLSGSAGFREGGLASLIFSSVYSVSQVPSCRAVRGTGRCPN